VLSRKVTIEAQHRPVGDLFDRVLAELNEKGPYRVGYGWLPLNAFYQNYVEFGAHDEPARDVLIRALRVLPFRYYMILNFEPTKRSSSSRCAPYAWIPADSSGVASSVPIGSG